MAREFNKREHPDVLRLFDAACDNTVVLKRDERDHLHGCEDCLQLFQTFKRQQDRLKEKFLKKPA